MRETASSTHFLCMAVCQTHHFGPVEYDDTSTVDFPDGIPAFPEAVRFVLIEPPSLAPVIYLQSIALPSLCFLTVPAVCLDPSYRLSVPLEELEEIGASAADSPQLLILSILTVTDDQSPTANLMAPVVIHRGTRRARQMIQLDGDYSFTRLLGPPTPPPSEEALC